MPTVEDIESQIEAANAKLAKLERRKQEVVVNAELEEKRAAFSVEIQSCVKDIIAASGMTIPDKGLCVYLHVEEGGAIGVDVLVGRPRKPATGGRPRGTGATSGNGERKTITALGIKSFTLADGSEVKSAAKVLDAHDASYYGKGGAKGGGDTPSRQIITWAKDNPDKAEKIAVNLEDDTTVTLKEAVEAF